MIAQQIGLGFLTTVVTVAIALYLYGMLNVYRYNESYIYPKNEPPESDLHEGSMTWFYVLNYTLSVILILINVILFFHTVGGLVEVIL